MADVTDVGTFRAGDYTAHLFALDGVITATAEVHMRAWAQMFPDFLSSRGSSTPYTDQDYFAYVDGRPRYDGVRTFLASRSIELPEGEDTDPSTQPLGEETVRGLGNRKNDLVLDLMRTAGVQPYPGTVAFLDALPAAARLAIVSSSRNAREVLRGTGLLDRFEHIVDGNVAAQEGLPGSPAPGPSGRAAELRGGPPGGPVVGGGAGAGARAGAAARFGAVIGVDRGLGHQALSAAGATLVVADLDEIT